MKGHSVIDQMKTKNFYIILLFIAATSVSLWLFSYPSSSFRVMVYKTHKQINNIKYLPSNLEDVRELTVNPTYLHALGFNKQVAFTEENRKKTVDIPVIATAVEPGKLEESVHLMRSVQKHLPSSQMVVFDLGLSKSQKILLGKQCNSTWHCSVRLLTFDKFPSHVQYLEIKSYRPICIQVMLNEFGSVIWTDTSQYFVSPGLNQTLLEQAKSIGFVAWTIVDSTSSLTHPKMFQYFKTKQEDFYFHRAVEASHLIIYNTKSIHEKLMLPWVKCALLEDCISPTGAQNVGCNHYRKPLFRYSGCHHYDMSALNVILGIVFKFQVQTYTTKIKVFDTLSKYKNNSTTPGLMSARLAH